AERARGAAPALPPAGVMRQGPPVLMMCTSGCGDDGAADGPPAADLSAPGEQEDAGPPGTGADARPPATAVAAVASPCFSHGVGNGLTGGQSTRVDTHFPERLGRVAVTHSVVVDLNVTWKRTACVEGWQGFSAFHGLTGDCACLASEQHPDHLPGPPAQPNYC